MQEEETRAWRYVGAVRATIFTRRADLLLAIALTIAGVTEALLGQSDGRIVRALAVPLATLPLAVRRDWPLAVLAAVLVSLLVQTLFGDFFDANPATTLIAMVIALYSAGRHAATARELAAAGLLAAGCATTRIVADPAVDEVGAAALTAIAVVLPLLVGRWVQGQSRLHHELEAKAERRDRERERDAREAAEEERMRIAADLQAAVADRLGEIVKQAGRLKAHIASGEEAPARDLLTTIAGSAREALADVRRVLGILRRDGSERRLAPPAAPAELPDAAAAVPEAATAPSAPQASAGGKPSAAFVDGLLVAAVLAVTELELLLSASSGDRAFAAFSAVTVAIPLLWRRRHPIPVALVVLAAVGVQSAVLELDSFPASDAVALMCASYAIAAYSARREAIAGLVLFAAGDALHSALVYPHAVPIALFGAAAVPWTIGRIVRGQRQLVTEAHDQAALVERARERDARAAVTAERMRVARELHDAVAHNISVIAIQAAGADGVLARDPARAAECAELIEEVGRDAIVELRRLAGIPAEAVGGDPQPTLARVDALAQRARDGGLPVELRVEGEPGGVAAGVDLAAFRIVQEALANASKHADAARAWVVVRYEQRAVEVEIGDDGRGPGGAVGPDRQAGANGGHGLVGMRERVALYGGTLDVGRRPGGGFAVRARLPLGGT